MASHEELERRIAKLEQELAELKRDRRTQIQPHEVGPDVPSYPPQHMPAPVVVPHVWGPNTPYTPPPMCSCPPNSVCNNVACPRAHRVWASS